MNADDLKGLPDGALVRLTVEGRIASSGTTTDASLMVDGTIYPLCIGGIPWGLLSGTTVIEVLPDPLVEPTKPHALVTDSYGYGWVRDRAGVWWQAGQEDSHHWDGLVRIFGPLTVLFEGIDDA